MFVHRTNLRLLDKRPRGPKKRTYHARKIPNVIRAVCIVRAVLVFEASTETFWSVLSVYSTRGCCISHGKNQRARSELLNYWVSLGCIVLIVGSWSYPSAPSFRSSLNANGRSLFFLLASAVPFPRCPLDTICCVASSVGHFFSLLSTHLCLELDLRYTKR